MQSDAITLVLADDHPLARTGIREILAEADDIQIVGEAQNGDEVEELLARQRTKILLLDLKMPGTSPAEIERWVRKHYPETVTLVLTAHDRDSYLAEMIDAGAAGYLSKSERAENLIAAIRRAAAGETLITGAQRERAKRWREEAGDKWGELTKRECEILLLVAEGLRNRAIANKLCITPKTVAFHISTILDKLGVESRHEATTWLRKYFPNDPEELQG